MANFERLDIECQPTTFFLFSREDSRWVWAEPSMKELKDHHPVKDTGAHYKEGRIAFPVEGFRRRRILDSAMGSKTQVLGGFCVVGTLKDGDGAARNRLV